MKRFKLGFRNRSGPEQMDICDKQIDGFARLPVDQRKDIDVAGLRNVVGTARASHRRIQQLRSDLKQELASHKTHLRAAREQVTLACWAAMSNANGQPKSMTEAGLELRRPWQKAGVPATPTNLRARPTAYAGEARLDWKRPLRRCLFDVQFTTNPMNADSWKFCASGSQQSGVVGKLVSGAEYYFRVRAFNIHGKSPWSNPAVVRVK